MIAQSRYIYRNKKNRTKIPNTLSRYTNVKIRNVIRITFATALFACFSFWISTPFFSPISVFSSVYKLTFVPTVNECFFYIIVNGRSHCQHYFVLFYLQQKFCILKQISTFAPPLSSEFVSNILPPCFSAIDFAENSPMP